MSRFPLLRAALLAMSLAGCGHSLAPATAPRSSDILDSETFADPSGTSGGSSGAADLYAFYPLVVGNRWTFEHGVRFAREGAPPDSQMIVTEAQTHLLTYRVSGGDREYVVESVSNDQGEGPRHLYEIFYRQDRAGLYEGDFVRGGGRPAVPDPAVERMRALVSARVRDERGSVAMEAAWSRLASRLAVIRSVATGRIGRGWPGGPRPGVREGEIQRLGYPLRVGRQWMIRDDDITYFSSTVVGEDVIVCRGRRLPAFRVRIESNLFAPEDVVEAWYGRQGFLGLRARSFFTTTNEDGSPGPTYVSEQWDTLTGFTLYSRDQAMVVIGATAQPSRSAARNASP